MADIQHPRRQRWYHELTRYHWWVLSIAILAWMFDCMAQRLFVLSRAPAVKELLNWDAYQGRILADIESAASRETDAQIAAGTVDRKNREATVEARVRAALDAALDRRAAKFGDYLTALMLVGWSVGGFAFGVFGDRLGRVRTLAVAILVYSVFTGLSGLAFGMWDFCLYRFLMGCGIGGAFANAATLIAETMPDHSRAVALGLFQSLSALGNIGGALIARFIVSPDLPTNAFGLLDQAVGGWRLLLLIGVLPAVLAVLVMRTIREPEAWHQAKRNAAENLERQLGDIRSLFATARWRRSTLVGVSLAVIGVIGLWGVGFYFPELTDTALKKLPSEEVAKIKATGMVLYDVGALLGMLAFTWIATRIGRRLAFGLAFVFCWLTVTSVFLTLREPSHVYWMSLLVGFATLSLFGGYSIYFPEIYPTRLRSSGTGFCYNVGRILAALVLVLKDPIRGGFESFGFTEPFRSVSVLLASVYLLGLVVLIFAPETKDHPLPTED
jgi:MFS family permease